MTREDINDLETRDYIFKIGDKGKGIQARYDENTDALIFPRAAFDYVYKLLKEALSQEPTEKPMCDRNICISNEYNGIGCDECIVNKVEQEPCEDVVSREAVKDILNNSYSLTDAEHRVEQLPSVTQKPIECDDAISREYLKKIAQSEGAYGYVSAHDIATAPSVTQKSGHWIHFAQSDDCSECGWSTGKYISPSKFCPNCGARMFEPQESEE